MNLVSLSIVIPVFNEEYRLPLYVKDILKFCETSLPDTKTEIIIVDDGSTDGTVALLDQFIKLHAIKHIHIIAHTHNQGKGAAVKTGIQHAQYAWTLFTDADGATPIHMLKRLINALTDSKTVCAIGCREALRRDQNVTDSTARHITGRIFNFCIRVFCFTGIRDTQCGFKLIRTDIGKTAFAQFTCPGWSFDVYLLGWLLARNLKIVEVGVDWVKQEGSKVRIWKDAPRMFLELMRVGSWLYKKPWYLLPFQKKLNTHV